jgi:hypothetical protein
MAVKPYPTLVHKFDVVQILHNGQWLDYATIKDESDLEGITRVSYQARSFRVQRYADRSTFPITKGQEFTLTDVEAILASNAAYAKALLGH